MANFKAELNGVVRNYLNTVEPIFEKIRNTTGSIAGKQMLPGLYEKIDDAKRVALDRGEKIFEDAQTYVDELYQLRGSDVDTTDLVLLGGAFKLTQSDIDDLAEKHKANGTMIRAIKGYADAHGLACGNFAEPRARKLEALHTARKSFRGYIGNVGEYGIPAFAQLSKDGMLFNELTQF